MAWREICPELVIRSTFIVGFPGETDDDFETAARFHRTGWHRPCGLFHLFGSRWRHRQPADRDVPEQVKEERYEQFMLTQQAVSEQRLQSTHRQTNGAG